MRCSQCFKIYGMYLGFLLHFSAVGLKIQEGVQQLRGSPRCCWGCWPTAMVASSPGAVPTAFLPCPGSVCRTRCQQQVRTCVLGCWEHCDAEQKQLGTAAGVKCLHIKVSDSLTRSICFFLCRKWLSIIYFISLWKGGESRRYQDECPAPEIHEHDKGLELCWRKVLL